jgi:hypothetical protein
MPGDVPFYYLPAADSTPSLTLSGVSNEARAYTLITSRKKRRSEQLIDKCFFGFAFDMY